MPCYFYIVREIVIVRDGLLLLVLDKNSELFFRFAHKSGYVFIQLLRYLQMDSFFVSGVFSQNGDEGLEFLVHEFQMIRSQLPPPFRLRAKKFREKDMIVVARQFSSSGAGVHLRVWD